MIQDGFDYGDGYEKATEPGDNLEFFVLEFWMRRIDQKAPLRSNQKYRKKIKPKDEKMEETTIKSEARLNGVWYHVTLSLDEAERVGEEAKRIKAEIAKREEIGPEDWFITGCKIIRCASKEGNYFKSDRGDSYYCGCCKKLHPTPEVRAWLDKTIGGEG